MRLLRFLLVTLTLWGQAIDAERRRRGREVVAECHTQFGMDMYRTMSERDQTSNMFFSPASIGTTLAMAYAGSRGETARQMAEVLHFEDKKSFIMRGHRGLLRRMTRRYARGVTVKMTNRVYVSPQLRVRRRYIRYMKKMFTADINQVNFGRSRLAAKLINNNVRKDTAGKIRRLIEPQMLDPLTRMVLVNGIYFKGDWMLKFNTSNTKPGDFHTPTGVKTVDMMWAKKRYPVGELYSVDARILWLPYKGNDVNMIIILPNERDGLQHVEEQLATQKLPDLIWYAEGGDEVEVKLPRFKLDERIDLRRVLEAMGCTDLFDAAKADLSGISWNEELYASSALHKAVIEVNEEGTEAAAATGIVLSSRTLRKPPGPFIVDRPFFFVIYDISSDVTLFMGRVIDPTV